MIPIDLSYNYPSGAYLFAGVLILGALFWRLHTYRHKVLNSFASKEILRVILVPRANYWLKVIATCLVWMFATLAFMQPWGNGHYPINRESKLAPVKEDEGIIKRKMHDVIFLVDASASMMVNDTRMNVSRFDYAKEIADALISKLKGENVALYAFTSEPTKLSPATLDYLYVRLMLRQMQINEGDVSGTDFLEAFKRIRNDFLDKTAVLKTLIVLSDGGDNRFEDLHGKDKEQYTHKVVEFLRDPQENKLRVFTIGMGTLKGGKIPGIQYEGKPVQSLLEESFLKQLSNAGLGKYYFANDWNAEDLATNLVSIMNKEQSSIGDYKIKRNSPFKGNEDLIYDLFFQYPLFFAIIMLAFALFCPDTWERK